jgi:hypothetical protein
LRKQSILPKGEGFSRSKNFVTTYSKAIGYQLSAISFQPSAFSHQLSAISFQLSAFSFRAFGFRLSADR